MQKETIMEKSYVNSRRMWYYTLLHVSYFGYKTFDYYKKNVGIYSDFVQFFVDFYLNK